MAEVKNVISFKVDLFRNAEVHLKFKCGNQEAAENLFKELNAAAKSKNINITFNLTKDKQNAKS